jgi:hypothetical protein
MPRRSRKTVIDHSIKTLVEIAQVIDLGEKGIQEIIASDYLDKSVYELNCSIEQNFATIHRVIAEVIKSLRLEKAIGRDPGSVKFSTCPSARRK